jgi:hypothetical protein
MMPPNADLMDDARQLTVFDCTDSELKLADVPTQPHLQVVPVVEAG